MISCNKIISDAGLTFVDNVSLKQCNPLCNISKQLNTEHRDLSLMRSAALDMIAAIRLLFENGIQRHDINAVSNFVSYVFRESDLVNVDNLYSQHVSEYDRFDLSTAILSMIKWIDRVAFEIEGKCADEYGISVSDVGSEWQMGKFSQPELIENFVHLWEYDIGDICFSEEVDNSASAKIFVNFGMNMICESMSYSSLPSCTTMILRLGTANSAARNLVLERISRDILFCKIHRHHDASDWYLPRLQSALAGL